VSRPSAFKSADYWWMWRDPRRSSSHSSFNGTSTPDIYTLSLHDALPIFGRDRSGPRRRPGCRAHAGRGRVRDRARARRRELGGRSEEHTSELQSRVDLVCRLLLEKKNCTYLREQSLVLHVRVCHC